MRLIRAKIETLNKRRQRWIGQLQSWKTFQGLPKPLRGTRVFHLVKRGMLLGVAPLRPQPRPADSRAQPVEAVRSQRR